jgi:hypothetical protein
MVVGNNKEERAMWVKLTRSNGSLLISPKKAIENATLPKV